MERITKTDNIVIFVLTYHWYDMIKEGIKKNEYRKVSVWERKMISKISDHNAGVPLTIDFRRGYTKTSMLFAVDKIDIIDGMKSDLQVDELVYDFNLGKQLTK